jgi:hypothetical protein
MGIYRVNDIIHIEVLNQGDNLEDLGVDGRIILKRNLNKKYSVVNSVYYLRIRTSKESLLMGNNLPFPNIS